MKTEIFETFLKFWNVEIFLKILLSYENFYFFLKFCWNIDFFLKILNF
jgi:hypothetical protein